MKKQTKIIIILCVLVCMIYPGYKATKKLYNKLNAVNTIVYSDSNSNSDACIYDTKPVSEAYLSGDTSKLSDLDKEIYDMAVKIFESVLTDDMTDYEKELALHDYIVTNVTYDTDNLGALSEHSENSDNPYGALINGKAICTGYTTTFKLFMDMLEIPNMVVCAQDSDGDDHAWNMIQLEDDWYYVDTTWDDPVPDEEGRVALHKYFNVTEGFLKENKHRWDSRELPKANSTKYSYENMTGKNSQELEYEAQTLY